MIGINAKVAKECLEIAIKAALVAFIGGSPGIGKSSVVHELADEYNLKLIDIRLAQCDPTDMNGMPFIFVEKQKAGYVPMEHFPLDTDPLPIRPDGKRYAGWLMFFDELSSAPGAVQAASYKVLLDKMVGQAQIHPNVAMAAAGNLDTDNAIVEEISSALQSRMVHLLMVSDATVWLDIAARDNIDPRITSFIRFKPGAVNTFNPDKQGAEKTYACERTWYFVNRLIKKGQLDLDKRLVALPLVAGCVGEGLAREFIAHTKIYGELPDIDDMVKNPKQCKMPTEPGHLYALSGSISHHMDAQNTQPLLDYVGRMPVEFQVTCVKEAIRRTPTLQTNPDVVDWMMNTGEDLF